MITEDGLMKKKLEREAIKKKEGGKQQISNVIFIIILIYCCIFSGPLIISSAGDPTMEPPKFSIDLAPVDETAPISEEKITTIEADTKTPALETPVLQICLLKKLI